MVRSGMRLGKKMMPGPKSLALLPVYRDGPLGTGEVARRLKVSGQSASNMSRLLYHAGYLRVNEAWYANVRQDLIYELTEKGEREIERMTV
jgi:Mn-dependent DtxR family transcriptional regulator